MKSATSPLGRVLFLPKLRSILQRGDLWGDHGYRHYLDDANYRGSHQRHLLFSARTTTNLSMPFDNNGQPYEYISITTLEATSEAIVQPLSRHYGFNRRLVYPMPHPYGAIGEARPTNRLPINTGPRPGAPRKQFVPKLRYEEPSPEIDRPSVDFQEEVADANQSTASYSYDDAEELHRDPGESSSATEDSIPVRQHNSDAIEDQVVGGTSRKEEEEEEANAEAQSGEEEIEPAIVMRPVLGSLISVPSELRFNHGIRKCYECPNDPQAPKLEAPSKPADDKVKRRSRSKEEAGRRTERIGPSVAANGQL